MAKAETKQEQAPAAAVGEATREPAVKVRILKTGTEIDGWRFAAIWKKRCCFFHGLEAS